MIPFNVTVRLPGQVLNYCAIGADSFAVHAATFKRFGMCKIFIAPLRRRPC